MDLPDLRTVVHTKGRMRSRARVQGWLIASGMMVAVVAGTWRNFSSAAPPFKEGGLSFVASAADPAAGRIFLMDRTYGLLVLDSRTGRILHAGFMPPGPGDAAITVDDRVGHAFVAVSTDPYSGIRTGPTTLSIIDTRTLKILHTAKLGIGPTSLALDTSTDHLIASNQGDDTATIVDAASGVVLHTVSVVAWPQTVVVDHHLHIAFILGRTSDHHTNAVSVLDTGTGTVGCTLHGIGQPSGGLTGAAIDDTTHHLVVANNGARMDPKPKPSVEILDGRSGQHMHSIVMWPHSLLVDSSAARLYVTQEPDTVWTVDANTGAILHKVTLPNYQRTASAQLIALDTMSQHLFVAGYWSGTTMLDARTGKILRKRQQGNGTTELVLDSQSHRVAAAGIFGVAVFDSRSGTVVRTLTPDEIARFAKAD